MTRAAAVGHTAFPALAFVLARIFRAVLVSVTGNYVAEYLGTDHQLDERFSFSAFLTVGTQETDSC